MVWTGWLEPVSSCIARKTMIQVANKISENGPLFSKAKEEKTDDAPSR
jgi:hypothetical protein